VKDTEVAGRYARALFAAAQSAKKEKAVREELRGFMKIWRTDPELAKALEHPLKSPSEKEKMVKRALGNASSGIVQRFIQLLLTRKRMPLLPYIAVWFEDVYDRANDIRKVHVKSADPMTKEQTAQLEKQLSKSWGGDVTVDVSVDKNLIGGIVIKSGDQVWDRSVRGQLARLKQDLLESAQN
jgi:F-type H+-transporting ATPase subunit delta